MELYGKNVLMIGVCLIILTLILVSVFLAVTFIRRAGLKKQLEKEYGKKD